MTDARELLALYALDALDDDERRAVEDLVARDPGAADELATLLETAALLGAAAADEPPTHLRSAVLEQIGHVEQIGGAQAGDAQTGDVQTGDVGAGDAQTGDVRAGDVRAGDAHADHAPADDAHALDLPEELDLRTGAAPSVVPTRRTDTAETDDHRAAPDRPTPLPAGARASADDDARAAARRRGARRSAERRAGRSLARFSLAAAAAVVLAVAVPGAIAWQQHERAVQAEARADLLTDVLTDPGATLLRSPVDGGGEAVAVLTDRRALLIADGLPALDDDLTYQLWAMRDGVPVPAGLFEARDGTVQRLAEDYQAGDGLAVSVEPAGGSEQPTTTPVVVLIPG